MRSVGLHTGRIAQFNLTNQTLATRWIVERWCAVERLRAMPENPTLLIGQEKTGAHVVVEPGFTHSTMKMKIITNRTLLKSHRGILFHCKCYLLSFALAFKSG